MQRTRRLLPIFSSFSALLLVGGCSVLPPPTAAPPEAEYFASTPVATDSCEVLGQVTVRADCACYDKMSYDRVRGRASVNLENEAHALYPDSDTVELLGIELYLNNAVARGVAYKCGTETI